jgi:hypothetical protein
MARIDSFLTPISFSISRDLARFSSFDMRLYPDYPIFLLILLFLKGGGQRKLKMLSKKWKASLIT